MDLHQLPASPSDPPRDFWPSTLAGPGRFGCAALQHVSCSSLLATACSHPAVLHCTALCCAGQGGRREVWHRHLGLRHPGLHGGPGSCLLGLIYTYVYTYRPAFVLALVETRLGGLLAGWLAGWLTDFFCIPPCSSAPPVSATWNTWWRCLSTD